ncbi:MAG: GNAT family N-acetyltransferase [Erysipelotrichaceae bacterium]|nr:GNAT family N-acetyltransferase [Erysipelotrichaceae bacterium]
MNRLIRRLFLGDSTVISGDVVDLEERYRISEQLAYDGIPAVYYDILKHGEGTKVGTLDIRLKRTDYSYYYGDIGYRVKSEYRGHHYAFYACQIAFKEAKEHFGMSELIITCNPDNIPSYKTLAALGGEYLGIEDVPADHEIYRHGDRQKCIFRYTL